MIGASIGRGAMAIINAIVRAVAAAGIPPNVLTTTGVLINVGCGLLFGFGEFFWAGIVLILANLFDMLDGNVARLTGNTTLYGAFLDSSLDRVSDMVCFVGIMIFYATYTPEHSILNVFLAGAGLIGSVMVSYTTARSEGLGIKANVGFLQRPERIVLFIIGGLSTWDWNSTHFLANRMPQVLWILAFFSFWTFVQRMLFTRKSLRKVQAAQSQ